MTAKFSTLNHRADFGHTAEMAVSQLRELATGLNEVLSDEGKVFPTSDTTEKGGVFHPLSLELKAGPKIKRAKK